MKTITKIIFAVLTIMIFFTACSKKDGDIEIGKEDNVPKKVAKEITPKDLLIYTIVEEYATKPEYTNQYGNKPRLLATYFQDEEPNPVYTTRTAGAGSTYNILRTEPSYNSETGITTIKTAFGNYELTRGENNEIIVKKSNYNTHYTEHFTSTYIKLVERNPYNIYFNRVYKEISGKGYYAFNLNNWRYKQDVAPIASELTWEYTYFMSTIWKGRDGGTSKYNNLFVIIPSGNGWKNQDKNKTLLIVNTFDNSGYKAVGDIGIYSIYNN